MTSPTIPDHPRPSPTIFDAVIQGDKDRFDALLAHDPTLATAFSADGWTALHLAAF